MKLKKTHWLLIAGAVVALAALGGLPSFSYVSVRGPDGDLTVQHAGTGGVHVKTDNADIRVNQPLIPRSP
jgi:hypothetical protein